MRQERTTNTNASRRPRVPATQPAAREYLQRHFLFFHGIVRFYTLFSGSYLSAKDLSGHKSQTAGCRSFSASRRGYLLYELQRCLEQVIQARFDTLLHIVALSTTSMLSTPAVCRISKWCRSPTISLWPISPAILDMEHLGSRRVFVEIVDGLAHSGRVASSMNGFQGRCFGSCSPASHPCPGSFWNSWALPVVR